MALKIIIGDTSCGKSNLICEQLAKEAEASPEQRFIAIVPEQATLLMQKNLIGKHQKKVITNIEIASFGFLSELVFLELGSQTKDILDDTGKALILRTVLEKKKDELLVYGRKARMPGFVEEIKSVITELKQYAIDDNALFLMQEAAQEQHNHMLFSKLQDIRLIYRAFEEEIAERYMTAEEILSVLATRVADSAIIRGSKIYMDGFTGFTPVQYKLISQLLHYAADVTVTVTLPEENINPACPAHDLFALSNSTYFKLKLLAEDAGVQAETQVLRKSAGAKKKAVEGQLFAGANPDEEVLFAAATILSLIKDRGYRFRDIAIVVSDMELYHRPVKRIFEEAGISFFIDHKRKLSENVLAHFLLSALRLVADRFSYAALFSCLKTGLTDLSMDEICRIENYCLEFGLKGIRVFREAFTKNRQRGRVWDLEDLNRIRTKLIAVIDPFYKSLSPSGNTPGQYRAALKTLFETNGVEKKIGALAEKFSETEELSLGKEYEQIYEQITGLLEKIETILPDSKLTPAEYADLAASGLEEMKVGIIPPSLDAVLVGDLTRTRLSTVKALFLLGANEGKIPKTQAGNMIFTQRERQFLKENEFEIAPTVLENIFTQRFYIYLMLSKPEETLYITYAEMGLDGGTLLPSVILQDLPAEVELTKTDRLPAMAWKTQKFRELAGSVKEPDAELLNYFAKERPERLKQILNGAFFSNRQLPIDRQVAEALYGGKLKGSVSRFEKFAECPFKHFMQYGIEAEKRPEYEMRATEIGTVYHDSLERYAKKLREHGFTFRDVPDEESRRLVKESVEEAAAAMEHDVLESTARNEYMKERILAVTEVTANVLREHVKAGKYEPEYFELQFTGKLSEEVRFSGKIDRVDLYDGEDLFVKIIDYKSGSKKFDVTDLYTGLQLQLAAYLKAAVKEAKKQYPDRNVQPGGVYYYLIQDKFVRSEEEAKDKFRMSGLTNCGQEALEAIDQTVDETHPGDSHIVEIKYGKTGLSSYSRVANTEEFNHMLDFTETKLREISEGVRSGVVEVAPFYQNDSVNGCRFCDYRDVCKFEDGNYGTSWNRKREEATRQEAEAAVFGRAGQAEDK